MQIGAYLTGSFGQPQALYAARNAEKRARGTAAAVEEQVRQHTATVLQRQRDAGFAFRSDPMFRPYYLFQPFAEGVSGVTVGPQENWFNNNQFYWRPILPERIDTSVTGFTERRIDVAAVAEGDTGMVVLPSPYTLLALSDVPPGADPRALLHDIATLIRNEARQLAARGIRRIQYDEPAFVHRSTVDQLTSTDYDLLAEAMDICGSIDGATTSLHTYFGNAAPLLPFLVSLRADCIGIDATETRFSDLLECAAESRHFFAQKELAVGLINARSAAMETPTLLADKLKRIADAAAPKSLWLTPNTGTEYIGWTFGMQKIDILAQSVAEVHRG